MSYLSSQNSINGPFETLFSNLTVPSGLVCKKYKEETHEMCSTNVCDTLVVPLKLFDSILEKVIIEPKHKKSRKNLHMNNKKSKTTRKKKTV